MIDVNLYLSQWPARKLPGAGAGELAAGLRAQGVTAGWAGSFDSLLHADLAGVNDRLVAECAQSGGGLLQPVGAINPLLPNWEEDLRRCHEVYRMRAIRLHPNYHGYRLDQPVFADLLSRATARGLLVQIALLMEDPRSQRGLLQVPNVEPAPLPDLLAQQRGARVMLLNGFHLLGPNRILLHRLMSAGVTFDLATLESAAGLRDILDIFPGIRVVFGSYAPYFYLASAALKLRESKLTAAEATAIGEGNAHAVLFL